MIGMPNFQDTFEIRKQPFISAFSICMTVPLKFNWLSSIEVLRSNKEILSK